jgi:hypothetical protein
LGKKAEAVDRYWVVGWSGLFPKAAGGRRRRVARLPAGWVPSALRASIGRVRRNRPQRQPKHHPLPIGRREQGHERQQATAFRFTHAMKVAVRCPMQSPVFSDGRPRNCDVMRLLLLRKPDNRKLVADLPDSGGRGHPFRVLGDELAYFVARLFKPWTATDQRPNTGPAWRHQASPWRTSPSSPEEQKCFRYETSCFHICTCRRARGVLRTGCKPVPR